MYWLKKGINKGQKEQHGFFGSKEYNNKNTTIYNQQKRTI
jgi:hypothetical protein